MKISTKYLQNMLSLSLLLGLLSVIMVGFVIGAIISEQEYNRFTETTELAVDELVIDAEGQNFSIIVGHARSSEKIDPSKQQMIEIGEYIEENLGKQSTAFVAVAVLSEHTIQYSDRSQVIGEMYHRKEIDKAIKRNEATHSVDHNLISPTMENRDLSKVLAFYVPVTIGGINYVLEVLYDTKRIDQVIAHIMTMIWIVIILSTAMIIGAFMFWQKFYTQQLEKSRKEKSISLRKMRKLNRQFKKNSVDLIKRTIELTELKGKIEDQNYDLLEANEQVKNLLEARTEFIRHAAHDLRTPLTPIISLIPILKAEKKAKERAKYIEIVEKNVIYLHDLIEQLVAYLRVQSGIYSYKLESVDLTELVQDILNSNGPVLKEKKVESSTVWKPNIPPVFADKQKITEVIQNILSNAIKFMPQGGKLTVSIENFKKSVKMRITDTGIGMKQDTLSRIFDEFFKADESRHIEGSGIGLAVCKKIVAGHNGFISAESEGVGKGSTFIVELPYVPKKEKSIKRKK